MNHSEIQNKTFLLLLAIVTVAFVWILLPFYGAVFWGVALAILFTPLYRFLLDKTKRKPTLAAIATVALCLIIVIIPLTMIAGALVQEITVVYSKIRAGQINFGSYFQHMIQTMPRWMVTLLERFGLNDFAGLQERISASAAQASQMVAKQAFSIGQNTFDFVINFGIMLYLLFFLLRDGEKLSSRIKQAVPLNARYKRHLFDKFTTVVKATVKGNIAVAAIQGLLGGLIFWILGIQGPLLWGVLMAFLSLLPAVGAGIVWAPVAIYFLLTGAIWQGLVLIAVGVGVIGLVDNVLRPILVGKDTKMPDYVVLVSTLGGMAIFGLNGFVIGPIIAALFMATWDLFSSVNEETN